MNKYQEALDELYKQRSERYNVFQKHKEWSKEIKEYDKVGDCLHLLQELVDKATPKKMKTAMNEHNHIERRCPICNGFVYSFDKYCGRCGQALDWSDEDDK